MAITLKDILAGQQRYLEKEKAQTTTETITVAEFREMAKQSTEQVNVLIEKTVDLKKSLDAKLDPSAQAEKDQEALAIQEKQIDLLEDIRDNTKKEKIEKEKPEDGSSLLSLGKILGGLVLAAGSIVGIIKAYVKTVKLFAEALTPEFVKKKIIGAFDNLGKFFDGLVSKVKGVLNKGTDPILKFFGEVGAKFEQMFATFSKSRFGVSVIEFTKKLSILVKPFSEALDAIKDVMKLGPINQLISKIGGFFNTIKTSFGMLGKAFGWIASTVGKIFTPVFIIMTAFETIMNAIDRFESDGIIGGLVGIVEGLFKSLIAAPIDLLKSLVSWVLGAFGFEEAEQFLDSFSVVDIVTDFVDAILSPIETIKKMFEGVVGFFEAIEIPKIGFTIPIIDKEVSIGPFYPFRREGAAQGQTTSGEKEKGSTASASSASTPPATSATASSSTITPVTATTEKISGEPASVSGSGVQQSLVVKSAAINGETAPADRQAYYKAQGFTPEQISNLNARQAKIDALKSQDPNTKIDKDLAVMDAQAAAIKSTPAQPSESVARAVAAPVPTANMVYNQSAQNATAAQAPAAASNNTIVAPTTVNNTKNEQVVHRSDLRNQDSTFRRLLDGRFMPA